MPTVASLFAGMGGFALAFRRQGFLPTWANEFDKYAAQTYRHNNKKDVPVLRISDRNTTGLRGSDEDMSGDWYSLTKSSGVSLKGEGKLGSFGIGKNVFWANSKLRMVYFSTYDVHKKWAFQGVAKWASHRLDGKHISRAVGFCGEKEFAPVRGKSNIPARFRASGTGSDIFVAGFDGGQNWSHDLIAAFAKNFFVAFHKDLLRVRIGDELLSAVNIGDVIEGIARDTSDAQIKNYWDALTAPESKEFTKTFPRLGEMRLRLLVREGASKGVAMFRGTGMMIFEKRRFRTPLHFAGVCLCDNAQGNEFLRRMEPPSHNAWEPERYEDDVAGAKEEIENLNKWLRECISDLSPPITAEMLDVPELEKFLPDEELEEPLDDRNGINESDPSPVEHTMEGRTRQQAAAKDEVSTEELDQAQGGEDKGEFDGSKTGEHNGGVHNDADQTEDDSDGKGSGSGDEAEPQPVSVHNRIYKQPGTKSVYIMRADLPSKGSYSVGIFAVGDDEASEPIKPVSAIWRATQSKSQPLTINKQSRVAGIDAPRGGLTTVEVEIPSRVPLSLSARFFRHG